MTSNATSFAQIVQKTWKRHLLFSVLIELTYKCNLNCFFCYNDLGLEGQTLTREQYFDLFEELADMQVFNLVLTGGEPLAHPDFFELGRKAKELNFMVRIKSNGHALNRSLAKRLKKEVDPFLVEVSLHGSKASTHDRQTRVPGSFDRLMENLQAMQDIGLRVRINSTMTRWNEAEIETMFEIAEDHGLPMHIDPIVTPRDDGDTSPLQIAPSSEGVARLLRLQHERAQGASLKVGRQADDAMPRQPASAPDQPDASGQEGARQDAAEQDAARQNASDKHCGAGSSSLAIDPYGNVFPCVQWRRPIGNLHQQSLGALWQSSSELGTIREINRQVKKNIDQLGAFGQDLNFCPGQAALESGSPLELYESAQLRAKTLGTLRQETKLPVIR